MLGGGGRLGAEGKFTRTMKAVESFGAWQNNGRVLKVILITSAHRGLGNLYRLDQPACCL